MYVKYAKKKNHLGGWRSQEAMKTGTIESMVLQMYETTLVKGIGRKVADLSNWEMSESYKTKFKRSCTEQVLYLKKISYPWGHKLAFVIH